MSTIATTKPSSVSPATSSNPTPAPTPSPTDLATQKVADRLTQQCAAGKGHEVMQELYADDARHTESVEMPGCARVTEGKPALLAKSEKFAANTTIHSMTCGKPLVNGDQFTCEMSMDCTCKESGKRMQITETCLYTVKNGKIAEAKFFYNPAQK